MSAISPKPPGTTPQSVRTPQPLIQKIIKVFGPLEFDLAADGPNICDQYFDEELNSLSINWSDIILNDDSWFWLNPPFNASSKFIPKCADEASRGARIISLVQTATSSNYWVKHVWGCPYVQVIHLIGRIPFEGYFNKKTGKPMGANIDCSLLVWNPRFRMELKPDERVMLWDWRKDLSKPRQAFGLDMQP